MNRGTARSTDRSERTAWGGSRRLTEGRGSGLQQSRLVGAKGFEPSTPASRTQCATGLRYAPTRRLTKNGNRIVLQDGGKTQAMCFSNSRACDLAVF